MAEFQFGAAPLNVRQSNLDAQRYTVSDGETLRSIARSFYGDDKLWYLIAQANGLSGSTQLSTGQTLSIPKLSASSNAADSFKPYDPSKVVGDLTPNLPMPQNDKGCGALGQIIMIVVAIVVTIYTAGAASGATGGFLQTMTAGANYLGAGAAAGAGAFGLTGTAGVVATGAVAAAAGSIASQLVGNAIGAVDGFSWKQVALSAVSAGVGAGLPSMDLGLGATGNFMARAAVGNAIGQGIGVVTGLQDHFDWRGVAASAASAGVGQAVGGAMGMNDPGFKNLSFGEQLGTRLVTGLAAGATTAVMRGGKIAIQQIAVDAFGNSLGDGLASAMSSAGQPTLTTGDFSRMDGASYRGTSYETARFQDALLDAFSGAGSGDMSGGELTADASGQVPWRRGYSTQNGAIEMRDLPGGHTWEERRVGELDRVTVTGKRDYAAELYASGAGDVRETTGSSWSEADIANMRQDNLARMQTLAAQTATSVNASASSYETGIYSIDPGSADYYRQRDGRFATEMSGVGDGSTTSAGGAVSGKELAIAAAQGAVHSVLGIVPEAAFQTQDMVRATLSVGYNEIVRPFTGGELWFPEMRSNTAQSYAQGASQTKLILGTLPVLNVGVFSYDTTRALIEGRTRDAAYGLGSFAGGMAVGAGMQRYGNVPINLSTQGIGALGGNISVTTGAGWSAKNARTYLRDIEQQTGVQVTREQRALLANDLRKNSYSRLSPEGTEAHRVKFGNTKDNLIAEWEVQTGREWPRYTEPVLGRTGLPYREIGAPYDAHHFIENSYGGPHTWWNIHPASSPVQHQGGIHRAGGPASRLFNE